MTKVAYLFFAVENAPPTPPVLNKPPWFTPPRFYFV
jgi:hypothetical protein